jgi:hypothetical protein
MAPTLLLSELLARFKKYKDEVDDIIDPHGAYHKPFATRTSILAFLLYVTLVFLALIELVCHRIYAHQGASSYGNLVGIHARGAFKSHEAVLAITVCMYGL